MKIIYITTIPSPFQIEFIKEANSQLYSGSIQFISERGISKERAHWKSENYGVILGANKIREIRKIYHHLNPDILVLTSYHSFITIYSVIWAIKNKKKYFIGPCEQLFKTKWYLKDKLKHCLFKLISCKSQGIFGIGNQAVRLYQSLYNGSVINIPYCFNLSSLLNQTREALSEELVFLYSGRLEDFRNPLFTIDVFADFIELNPDRKIKLIISGQGSLYSKCLKLIEERGITNNIEWINEFKDWYDIHNLYFKAHVLLCLQKYSGWGIIIQEAMAAGMPVIASNTVTAADDLIINDYNGYLISINDRKRIIKNMQNFLNPVIVEKFGERSREIIETIDVKKIAARFVSPINELNINKT